MADAQSNTPKLTGLAAIRSVIDPRKYQDVLFAFGIVGMLSVLLFPIPTGLLDMLLAISISIAMLILMNVLFIDRSLDFNSFPTILLIAALFRLALNIASTRLILSEGHTGAAAAGRVIEAFGSFVMQGSVAIGVIVFTILTLINFIVITKGSGRIAEVSARFSLDAMPGKQMAIDADLSAGLIDEDTAKTRRKELESESTFFGAMDGASKFVRGDAVAGILITLINFVAGIIIGMVQRDMSFDNALSTYTLLTIGDGLVSQIPALVVSTSAGLLVTKSGVAGSADKAVFGQLGRFPQALGMASTLLFAMGLMPGLPAVPFWFMSLVLGGMGFYIYRQGGVSVEEAIAATKKAETDAAAKPEEEPIEQTLKIDDLKLELGYGLLPLINYNKGHRITDQIKALRKQIAKDLGFVMPSMRIVDNMQLGPNEYAIKVKEIQAGKGEVQPNKLMVMDPAGKPIDIAGIDTNEPTFGLPAKWIDEPNREEAMFRNYTVVDPPTVITTHVTEIVKEQIASLLSFSEVQKLLDGLEDHKKLVAETVPSMLPVSSLQRVLQNLLQEQVSIRDIPGILEAVAEIAPSTKNLSAITEHVRTRLARQISNSQLNPEGVIAIVTLSAEWEQRFAESLIGDGRDRQLAMEPSRLQEFIGMVKKSFERHAMQGQIPVLLTSPSVRPYVRAVIERFRPSTVVMSQNEVHPKVKLKNLGMI